MALQEVSLAGTRLVIDSSKLQSAELREFLSASTANLAVLPDFAWFEVFKQETVAAVLAFLSRPHEVEPEIDGGREGIARRHLRRLRTT